MNIIAKQTKTFALAAFLSLQSLPSAVASTPIVSPAYYVTTLNDNGTEIQTIRKFQASLTANTETWVPLGAFKTGTVHRLTIGGQGSGANTSAICNFSVRDSGNFKVHRLEQLSRQATVKLYWYKDIPNHRLYIFVKYTGALNHTLEVNYTADRANAWSDDTLPAADFSLITSNHRLSPDIETHHGLVGDPFFDSIGKTAGIHFNRYAYFHGDAYVRGSEVLTEDSISTTLVNTFVSKGNPTNGALMAIGTGAVADGSSAIAIGDGANAADGLGVDPGNIAIGNSSTAHFSSVSLGSGTSATGSLSFAAGAGANASGGSSVALGQNSVASGIGSFAAGRNSTASAMDTIALGNGSVASKTGSFAAAGGKAQAQYSLAIGADSIVDEHSTYSVALGVSSRTYGLANFNAAGGGIAWSDYEAVVGIFNEDSSVSSSPERTAGGGSLFTVGNGETGATRSNALEVMKSGATVLTNKAWENQADPLATSQEAKSNDGKALIVEGHTHLKGKVIIEQPQGDISMGIFGTSP